jgi:hypothetical protein
MTRETNPEPKKTDSRRTVVKSGIAVGGALWAVPVVQAVSMTKAAAEPASGPTSPPPPPPPPPPPTGRGTAISYVILVLSVGGSIVTMKVDGSSGGVSCPASASSDFASDTLYTNYLTANGWTTVSSSHTCPAVDAAFTNGKDLNIGLGSNAKMVGYMVHDGSLHGTGQPTNGSQVRFSPGTTLPTGAFTSFPSGWVVPSGPSGLGATVTFHKP